MAIRACRFAARCALISCTLILVSACGPRPGYPDPGAAAPKRADQPSASEILLRGRVLRVWDNQWLDGVRVCAVGVGTCAETDAHGQFALALPANAEVALTLVKQGFVSIVIAITTSREDQLTWKIGLHNAESPLERSIVTSPSPSSDGTGSVRPWAGKWNEQGKLTGFAGVLITLLPASGVGPKYLEADGSPSDGLTSTSRFGGALFSGVTPGEVLIHYDVKASCSPTLGGWPAGSVNSVRVPVIAGFQTNVSVGCK